MTMSAEKGGENMSENIRNGFVSWIHSKGYGFAECDDDEIEDSFIPPNLIEKHENWEDFARPDLQKPW